VISVKTESHCTFSQPQELKRQNSRRKLPIKRKKLNSQGTHMLPNVSILILSVLLLLLS